MFKKNLETKILGLVVASLLVGFLVEFSFNYYMDTKDISKKSQEEGQMLADSISRSIKDYMLEGRADVARRLMMNLEGIRNVELLQIIRKDGTLAFTDMNTMNSVLKRTEDTAQKGTALDTLKHTKTDITPPVSETNSGVSKLAGLPEFKKALESGEDVSFTETLGGKEVFTFLQPMKNEEKCQTCHGSDHKVRGIIRISFSLEEARQDLRIHIILLAGVSLFVIILNTLLLRTWIKRFIITPVLKIADAAQKVAEGDLHQHVEISQKDEIGELGNNFNFMVGEMATLAEQAGMVAKGDLLKQIEGKGELVDAFNSMMATLRQLIIQLREAGDQIEISSSDILSSVEHQASSSVELAASVAQVTATIEELTSTASQIAENSGEVEKVAEDTEETARRGAEAVYDAIKAMDTIKLRVADITKKTVTLGEKSRHIGEILEIIQDIAGEIHLLALNAAIESAAAGEHGKRFAVVAAEVRRLAERTKESASEIKSIVTEIQSATNASVMATEQGAKEVENGSIVAEKAGKALTEILEMVEQTSTSAKQISMATHQQKTANEQVAMTMKEISEITKQSAAGLKQSSVAAAMMSRLADDLKEKISQFKVDRRNR